MMAINLIKSFNLSCRIASNAWVAKSNLAPKSANLFTSSCHSKEEKQEITIPPKPKRPLTPYLQFVKDNKPHIVEKYNINQSKAIDIAKKCGEEWRNTDPSIKTKYENEYKDAIQKFNVRFEKYRSDLTEEQKNFIEKEKDKKKKSKKLSQLRQRVKQYDKPKKPPTAFVLYLMDECNSQNKTLPAIMNEMKGAWNMVDDGKKAAYVDRAEKLKVQYDKDLLTWELKMLELGNVDLVRYKTVIDHGTAEDITVVNAEKKKRMTKLDDEDGEKVRKERKPRKSTKKAKDE